MHGWQLQMWSMHWAGWLFGLAGLVLLVVIVIAVVRALPPPPDLGRQMTATEVLDRRYAAGEISTEEYEERKQRLARQ